MAHVRSKQARKRLTKKKMTYTLKTFINQMAWHDSMKAETICLTTHTELRDIGYSMFGENFSCTFIPDVDRGYVLTDGYGRGAFQR